MTSVCLAVIKFANNDILIDLSRLTEEGNWRVLLLEAGGDETEISDVPALAAYLQLGRMDWKYKTEPQPGRACLGHTNQR